MQFDNYVRRIGQSDDLEDISAVYADMVNDEDLTLEDKNALYCLMDKRIKWMI